MRLLVVTTLIGLAGAALAAAAVEKNLGSFAVKVPEAWKSVPTTSTMRKAQWALPRAEGDKDDAELVVFFFGAAGGGGVQANLDRWYGQFKQPDGSDTKSKAKSANKKADGMDVVTVDVSGTYVAPKQIGNPAAGAYNEKDYRMLAAIVGAPDGDHFFKLVGPQKTIARWSKDFEAMIASAKKK